MTAAKVMDIISRFPDCDGQAADASIRLYSSQKRKMLTNYWKFPNRNVQTFGFVYHDTDGPSHGPVSKTQSWKTQSFLLSEICTVIFWQGCYGKGNLWKSYSSTVSQDFVDKFRTMFESRTSADGTEKLPYSETSWMYRDINLAIKKGLTFYQTRSNAIILQETLPACCIPKVVRMKTGEVLYEKVYMSPRPPPEISLKHEWKRELGSDHAQRAEAGQPSGSFQSNQPTPNPIRERSGRLDITPWRDWCARWKKNVPFSRDRWSFFFRRT